MKFDLRLRSETLAASLFSVISAFGLLYYISKAVWNIEIRGSVVCVPIIASYYFLWRYLFYKKHFDKNDIIVAGIFTYIFSLALSLGYQLDLFDPVLKIKGAFSDALIFSMCFFPLVLCIIRKIKDSFQYDISAETSNRGNRKFLISFFGICGVWFCVWLAMWPGMFGYDGTYWYAQQSAGYMNAKWSLPYQIIFYFFLSQSHKIFGNYEIGFSVFTLLQSIYVLYAISRILKFVQKRLGSKWLIIVSLFFSLNLPVVILSMSSAQDAPFMAAFAMCILLFLELSINPKAFWASKKNSLELLIWLLMLFFWRNNGLFATVFVIIAAISGIHYYGKRLLLILLTAITIFELYSGPFLTFVGANKSTTVTEMMSVPATQLAYVWNYERKNMSQEDLNEMYYYLPQEFLNNKNFITDNRIADQYKANLNAKAIKEDPVRFAKFYCKTGRRFSKAYLTAHLDLTLGLWYPDIHYYDYKMFHPYIEYVSSSEKWVKSQNPDYITTARRSKFSLLQHVLDYLFGPETLYGDSNWKMGFNESILLSILYKPGLYFWIFILLILYSIAQKRRTMALPISLYVGLFLTVILGPVILFRYIAPIIMSAPLLASLFVVKSETIMVP